MRLVRSAAERAGKRRTVDHELPGSSPIASFTAFWNRCLQPKYFSVLSIDTCPRRNWICSSSPPACAQARTSSAQIVAEPPLRSRTPQPPPSQWTRSF
jgi:hypothetical protein